MPDLMHVPKALLGRSQERRVEPEVRPRAQRHTPHGVKGANPTQAQDAIDGPERVLKVKSDGFRSADISRNSQGFELWTMDLGEFHLLRDHHEALSEAIRTGAGDVSKATGSPSLRRR